MAVRFTSWFLPTTGTTSKFKAFSGAEKFTKCHRTIVRQFPKASFPKSLSPAHHKVLNLFFPSSCFCICIESYRHNWKDLISVIINTPKKPQNPTKPHKQNSRAMRQITIIHPSDALFEVHVQF